MPKRFTATEKWSDPWFRKLPPEYKCFWSYLCDNCNNAGIWNVDVELAEILIGAKLDLERVKELFGDRLRILEDPQYWMLPGFIPFQCGELNEACRPHQHILGLLAKHRVSIPFPKGIQRGQDKKEVEVKKLGVRDGMEGRTRFVKPVLADLEAYAQEIQFPLDAKSFLDYYEARGWQFKQGQPMKDWKAAVRYWKQRRIGGEDAAREKLIVH